LEIGFAEFPSTKRNENSKLEHMSQIQLKARDNARTPVQWTSDPHAGFSTTAPWMRVNEDYLTWNAAAQTSDPGSVFSYW
jgi:oligo-1,6-glucosidase